MAVPAAKKLLRWNMEDFRGSDLSGWSFFDFESSLYSDGRCLLGKMNGEGVFGLGGERQARNGCEEWEVAWGCFPVAARKVRR